MRRSRMRRSGGRGKRRKMTWGDSFWFSNVTGAAAPGTSIVYTRWLKNPAGENDTGNIEDWHEPEDETLVRSFSRFGWSVAPGSATPTGFVAAGWLAWDWIDGVSTPTALQVPLPVDNFADADWCWKQVIPISLQQNVNIFSVQSAGDQEYWSRAQRKLSARTGLLLVVQALNENQAGSWTFDWSFYTRFLLKKP